MPEKYQVLHHVAWYYQIMWTVVGYAALCKPIVWLVDRYIK